MTRHIIGIHCFSLSVLEPRSLQVASVFQMSLAIVVNGFGRSMTTCDSPAIALERWPENQTEETCEFFLNGESNVLNQNSYVDQVRYPG
jgi:hypothetical protein